MMRKINKKWKFDDSKDHVVLMWRDFEVLIDHDDFHYFEESVLRIIYNKRKFDRHAAYLYIVHGSKSNCYTYETFHRVILNANESQLVDHINGNSLDNRKCNLRIATHAQNIANSRKVNRFGRMTSQYKGVSTRKCKKNPYRASITKDKKLYQSKHETEIEAAKWYNEMAIKLFGEFARLNKI